MKHAYYLSFVLILTLTFAGLGYVFKDGESQPAATVVRGNARATSVDKPVLPDIEKSIGQREYHITFDTQNRRYQSPNRQHNLRAFYEPGVLTVRNRKDSAGHIFEFKLVNQGVYADKKRIDLIDLKSIVENKDNTAEIRHSTFTEQYINSSEGIRQNFIVEKAPVGTEELSVKLQLKGLKARDIGTNTLAFYNEKETATELIYSDLKCWDAAGAPLEASLELNEGNIQISVDVRGAAYPVTIDPIISNGNPGNAIKVPEADQNQAWMGGVVSSAGDVNGDGYSDVLVGASKFDNGQIDEGAVFVYYGSATGITMAGGVMLESDQKEARFGCFASSAGDINKDGFSDIIVGAHMYDKGQTNEGAAFVYYGSAQGINKVASLVLESNQAEANMGNTVGLAGDVNGDGYSDVLVCARAYDKGQTNEGVVFLYHGSAAGLNTNNPVIIEANQAEAMMGFCASGAGDVNGDGYSDILVGARLYDKGQTDEGAVFVYHGSALGINPANAATVLESNQANAYLGHTAATAGDVNGDGYSDIIIGANMYDKGQTNEGAAFMHYGSAQGINMVAAATLESNQAEAQFGYSVASAGDVNGDGYADVIVGAMYYDNGQSNEGAAFVYQGSQIGISATPVSTLESNQAGAQFGSNVASAGDVNGDGYSDVIVGAVTYDNGNADEGGAFVWLGEAKGIDMVTSSKLETSQAGSSMGNSVANAGDVNGDGFEDILVGAPFYDNGQVDEGVVFLYHGSPDGVLDNQIVVSYGNQSNAFFGHSVSTAGDINGDGYDDIVIGAPGFTEGQNLEGGVFVYFGSQTGIDENSVFIIESDQVLARLGKSVSAAGDVNGDGFADIVLGAYLYDNGQDDEGVAFVHYGSKNGIDISQATMLESNQSNSQFGVSVAGAGDINGDGFGDVMVGAYLYDNGQVNEGAAFIFHGSSTGMVSMPAKILEVNQQNAKMGISVSSAGDVNGDGFFDVIVGVPHYANGQLDEGLATVFYGSTSGKFEDPPLKLELNYAAARLGWSVSTAGDINGDGYGDVLVGAPYYSKNQVTKGSAFVFHGSPTGLKAIPVESLEVLEQGAQMGYSVSKGGDVNGDGYSDVIIGAPFFEGGSVFICYGNTGANLKNNLRLYNTNLTTPINQTQFAQNNFGAGLYSKSFLGGNKGKLVWETKAAGQGFSKGANNVITNSTQSSGSQNLYASLGLIGVELKNVIPKQGPATKVRVRVKYDPALALTGQTYGPWRYLPSYLTGNGTAPVPDEGMQETISRKALSAEGAGAKVNIYPNPVSDKLFIGDLDRSKVVNVQIVSNLGRSLYKSNNAESEIDVSGFSPGVYVLILKYTDGSQSTHRIAVKR
ncbi:FG-GAP-like repeat-containing protein [Dyadobacter sp. CY343]|uniref:FG-GAP-like repeat-containing protein n=1 Tax=Dyadobacter sp. CY343 TaxID=2907299 RepID=UPI001F19BD9C|nr:FG-GAP-like repeat-containing protein [Dyadobacter sp. CY343]MCE7060500.1 FG-GAP-like repeat-containing protein [Dyadobacter sp. CY343]